MGLCAPLMFVVLVVVVVLVFFLVAVLWFCFVHCWLIVVGLALCYCDCTI